MPQPAVLDTLQEPLLNSYRQAWLRVVGEQEKLAADPLSFRRRSRLAEVRRAVEEALEGLDDEARAWVTRQLPRAYLAGATASGGATGPSLWTQINTEAVQELAGNLFSELLQATQGVQDSTKQLIRAVAQDEALQKAIVGKTADQAAQEMRRVLEKHGIHAIRYADGSRHGLAEYSQVAMRTTTAKAYNAGTLGAVPEVGFFEIFDGPNCGLSFHEDPTLALGLIVDRGTAEKYLISHPNCRRSFGPRPDVTTKEQAEAAKSGPTPQQTQAQLEQDALRGDREAVRALRSRDPAQARAERLAARQERIRPGARAEQAVDPRTKHLKSFEEKGGTVTRNAQQAQTDFDALVDLMDGDEEFLQSPGVRFTKEAIRTAQPEVARGTSKALGLRPGQRIEYGGSGTTASTLSPATVVSVDSRGLILRIDGDVNISGDPFDRRVGGSSSKHWVQKPSEFEVIAAYGDDVGLSGALGFAAKTEEGVGSYLFVDYLGTTGTVPGTGTRLAVEAAREASKRGVPVMGEPTVDSLPFWKKMGWVEDPLGLGTDLWGWSADEVVKVAGL